MIEFRKSETKLKTMKKNKMQIYRQGDVLVQRVKSVPSTAKAQSPINGRVILAYGEVTGHHHSIEADAADWWKSADTDDQFIDVKQPTQLVHQEHSAVALKLGKYRVSRQREYSPAAIRNVAD